jgi:hypothetical protein
MLMNRIDKLNIMAASILGGLYADATNTSSQENCVRIAVESAKLIEAEVERTTLPPILARPDDHVIGLDLELT